MGKRSTYGRFKDGVQISGVSMNIHQKGRIYYVCNSTVAAPFGIVGSDDNDGLSPERPLATIDAAINKCVANRGDKIIVLPKHAETVDAATDIVPDVAGVQILGQGIGEERPIITFATSTAANIPVSAANVRISGMVFKCNIASQVAMITVSADDVEIDHCEFREGTATGLNFITLGSAADNDADRAYIHDCRFYMPTAGNGDHAIEFLYDFVNVRIEDCEIDGDFDEGAIAIPAGGNAQVNLQILRCNIKNRLTNIAAISINGTGSSGIIQDCLLRTDTLATALDNGSLATDNVRWADETDQVSSTPVFVAVDSASNVLGADNANNAFASTSVTANRDGSVLERLEHIANNLLAETPATFVPGLGYRVTKTEDVNTATSDDLFTVTGKVLITLWTAEVTNALDTTVTDYKISLTTLNADLCAAGDISSSAVGHMFQLNSDAGDTSLNSSTYAVSVTGSADTNGKGLAMRVVGKAGGSETIKAVRTAGAAGDAIIHTIFYLPLEASASVAAAA